MNISLHRKSKVIYNEKNKNRTKVCHSAVADNGYLLVCGLFNGVTSAMQICKGILQNSKSTGLAFLNLHGMLLKKYLWANVVQKN